MRGVSGLIMDLGIASPLVVSDWLLRSTLFGKTIPCYDARFAEAISDQTWYMFPIAVFVAS